MESSPQWTPSCSICETFVAGIYHLYEDSELKKSEAKTQSNSKVRDTLAEELAGVPQWMARYTSGDAPEINQDSISWIFECENRKFLRLVNSAKRCHWRFVLDCVWRKCSYLFGDTSDQMKTIQIDFNCVRDQKVEGALGDIVLLKTKGWKGYAKIHVQNRQLCQYWDQPYLRTSLTVQQI